jgi:CMP-N-acetylneuraminic acid synthetase
MILGKKFIAIIPARIGSKRLKFKNLQIFNGKPLFMWSMISAQKSKYIDKIYLSTDSKKINNIAFKNGFKITNLRPKNLSRDKTTSSELILDIFNKMNEKFDFFVLLQPTSPLRIVRDIDGAIETIISKGKNSLISVNSKNNRINGALYIQNIKFFRKNKKFKYRNTIIFKMPNKRSVDIDTKEDFKQALKYCS